MKILPILIFAVVVAVGGFGLGLLVAPGGGSATATTANAADTVAPAAEPTRYTCPMHPQIVQPKPGDCSICGMDLVPMSSAGGSADAGPRRLAMSAADRALAELRTAPVERRFVEHEMRFPGQVRWDETRIRTLAARVPGRLVRMFVDYTGTPVRIGDHLVQIDSPELLTAQQELLEIARRLREMQGRSEFLVQADQRAMVATREKLQEFGLIDRQLQELLQRGAAEPTSRIDSPFGGVVIEKMVDEGDYVKTGDRLFRIAETDHLWVEAEVWERDLPWVRYGQRVTVTAEALPGRMFDGRISFLSPEVDSRTRTVTLRVHADNPEGLLKPGMFVRVAVRARLDANGDVLDTSLAGKWISPMHPDVVADGPGVCSKCGMDLVPAEELGYRQPDAGALAPLVVPSSAVLATGRRAVVYVEVEDAEMPTYAGRDVVLGPRAGEDWIIVDGLEAGEKVVIEGAFKIDSALQIRGEPSMMSQPGRAESVTGLRRLELPPALREALGPVYRAVVEAGLGLAEDSVEQAAGPLRAVGERIVALPREGLGELPAADRAALEERLSALAEAAERAGAAVSLATVRARYEDVSKAAFALHEVAGHGGELHLFEVFCPMAFDDRGARWLSFDEAVRNPYFGSQMYACGEVEQELDGSADAARDDTDGQPGDRRD